jgi:NitT/TauT family transport system substrate-binding protein
VEHLHIGGRTAGGIFKRHGINLEIHLAGYRETIDWLYADPAALDVYADFAGITAAKAMRVRDQFFPKPAISPDEVTGLDLIIPDAI